MRVDFELEVLGSFAAKAGAVQILRDSCSKLQILGPSCLQVGKCWGQLGSNVDDHGSMLAPSRGILLHLRIDVGVESIDMILDIACKLADMS